MNKESLQAAIKDAEDKLAEAKAALMVFEAAPEQNTFETMDDALATVEEKLRGEASEDCEGSYRCGAPTYSQVFVVAGVQYIGTLKCEYNRHDKTYYYLEEAEFSHKEAESA